MENKGEIVVYQPNDITRLEVRIEHDSVWLTQAQIAELFQRDRTVVTRHIKNVFGEQELEEKSNVHFLHFANSDKPVKYYSLDVIISVGYRIKSIQGTRFRQWANHVLKNHLLKRHLSDYRITEINDMLLIHDRILKEHSEKIDFFVRTSLPPTHGIFFNGQMFDAYVFAADLIRSASKSVVLIDNYIDETVLTMLDKREKEVEAIIYTKDINRKFSLDLKKHNEQYRPVEVRTFTKAHDRFLLIDEKVYHIGASLKDLGRKWFAFSLMTEWTAQDIIDRIQNSDNTAPQNRW